MIKIVGIHGKAGSGKSTVARVLQSLVPIEQGKAVIKAFATPLKLLCSEVYDYPHALNYSAEGKTVRPPWACFPFDQDIFPPEIPLSEYASTLPDFYKESSPWFQEDLDTINALVDSRIDDIHNVNKQPVTVGRILQTVGQAFRDVREDHWVNFMFSEIYKEEKGPAIVILEDVRYISEAQAILAHDGKLIKVTGRKNEAGRDTDHPSENDLDSFDKWTGVIENNGSFEELEMKVSELVKEGLFYK
jgi:energy-coupling factor transporter ATP-binding protein EcfA2